VTRSGLWTRSESSERVSAGPFSENALQLIVFKLTTIPVLSETVDTAMSSSVPNLPDPLSYHRGIPLEDPFRLAAAPLFVYYGIP